MDRLPNDRIRRIREALGVTQVDLAARVGINQGLLSRVERGLAQSWPKLRRDTARALGIDEQRLWPPDS